MKTVPGKIDPNIIKKYANVLINEEILTRIKLLRKHSDAYRSIARKPDLMKAIDL